MVDPYRTVRPLKEENRAREKSDEFEIHGLKSWMPSVFPNTPCMVFLPISWGGLGGQCSECRYLYGIHGVFGVSFSPKGMTKATAIREKDEDLKA